ncbi:MAG: hypothetical protein E3J43_06600 [Candidatus Heimdallarchaeota archaeon]|nr:MAG: hypothetical protein E3J43_06600 [Candidatus Heimdallarchaeota archaeon]
MATQELIYDLPQIAIQDSVLRYSREVPLLKDIVAFAVHFRNDLKDEDAALGIYNAGALKGLQINVYADSEKINYFGEFIRLIQARFYKFFPQVTETAGDGGGDDGDWYMIVPVNIPADKFNNVRFELDLSQMEGLDDNVDNIVSGTIDVAVVYGDAVKGTFLTLETSYHTIAASGRVDVKPPLDVELIDIYVVNDAKKGHEDDLTTFVFKAGTERLYDTTKGIMKIMSAVDTYMQNFYYTETLTDETLTIDYGGFMERHDEVICTLNPTLITDGTMALTIGNDATGEEGFWVGWLIRKTV